MNKKILNLIGNIVILIILLLPVSCLLPYDITEGTEAYAVCNYIHCGIIISEKVDATTNRYTHYTYANAQWYLFNNQTFDVWLDMMFTGSSQTVLEIAIYEGDKQLKEVISQLKYWPTPDGWLFHIPPEKISGLTNYIKKDVMGNREMSEWEIIKNEDIGEFKATYYITTKCYGMFYSCVNFVAYGLQSMGVDIQASWYTYSNQIIRDRLNMLTDMISFQQD